MSNNICIELGEIIRKTLTPLIKGDYIFLDLPYHGNIGDTLIWKGTESFLRELPGKCLGQHSKDTFDFRSLPQDCTILLFGGGNLGDIWREHQEFRLEVMRIYPDNSIIVLPQTVFYENKELLLADVEKMNKHEHLTICARDKSSAKILEDNNFKGKLLTVPDMAFCINPEKMKAEIEPADKDTLILMRKDKEIQLVDFEEYQNASFEDWPEIKESGAQAWHHLMTHTSEESDDYFVNEYFPQRIDSGIKFVSSYKEVYSTRLHVAILRLLLDMPVVMLDNSYGKNKSFYESWLQDTELATMLSKEESFKMKSLLSIKTLENEFQEKISVKDEEICHLKREIENLKKQLAEERYWLKVNKDWAHKLLAEKEDVVSYNKNLQKDLVRVKDKLKKYKKLFKICAAIACASFIFNIILLAL